MAAEKKKGKSKEGEMSFLEHLEELRWHIIQIYNSNCNFDDHCICYEESNLRQNNPWLQKILTFSQTVCFAGFGQALDIEAHCASIQNRLTL